MNKDVYYVLKRLNHPGEVILDNHDQSYACGRGKDNDIFCLSLLVSRRHCIFIYHSNGLYIRDLRSSNGVYVNGEKKLTETKLNADDIVGIGVPDLNPNDPEAFVYCVREMKFRPGRIKADSTDARERDKVILKKKRLVEDSDDVPPRKIAKYSAGESCTNNIPRLVSKKNTDLTPSGSNFIPTVDLTRVKKEYDDEDEIEIIDVCSSADKNAGNNKAGAGPSRITNEIDRNNIGKRIIEMEEGKVSDSEDSKKKDEMRKIIPAEAENKLLKLSNVIHERQLMSYSNDNTSLSESLRMLIVRYEKYLQPTANKKEESAKSVEKSPEKSKSKPSITDVKKLSIKDGNIVDYQQLKENNKTNDCLQLSESDIQQSVSSVDNPKSANFDFNNLENGDFSSSENFEVKQEPDIVSSINNYELNQSFKEERIKVEPCCSSSDSTILDKSQITNYNRTSVPLPELKVDNVSDDDVILVAEATHSSDDNNSSDGPIEQQPSEISLESVKKEAIVSYSGPIHVYVISDDEDDEESMKSRFISNHNIIKREMEVEIKNEIEETEDDTILVSDSDEDENNPWFEKLMNSQVYRPSQEIKSENKDVGEAHQSEEFKLDLSEMNDSDDEEARDDNKSYMKLLLDNQRLSLSDDQDEEVWDENVQSQETAEEEAKSFKEESRKKVVIDEQKKSFKLSKDQSLVKNECYPSEKEAEKRTEKRKRREYLLLSKQREDLFVDDEEDEDFEANVSHESSEVKRRHSDISRTAATDCKRERESSKSYREHEESKDEQKSSANHLEKWHQFDDYRKVQKSSDDRQERKEDKAKKKEKKRKEYEEKEERKNEVTRNETFNDTKQDEIFSKIRQDETFDETSQNEKINEAPQNLFDSSNCRTSNLKVEIEKLDGKFIARKNDHVTSKDSKESEISKSSEELIQKKQKSWDEEFRKIDETTSSVKAKQQRKKGLSLIAALPMREKGKRRSRLPLLANDDSSKAPFTKKKNVHHSTDHRMALSREVKQERSEKLKQLATKEREKRERMSLGLPERPRATGKAKVTLKTRQDFLVNEQQKAPPKPGIAYQRINSHQPIAHCSKSVPEIIPIKASKDHSCVAEDKNMKFENLNYDSRVTEEKNMCDKDAESCNHVEEENMRIVDCKDHSRIADDKAKEEFDRYTIEKTCTGEMKRESRENKENLVGSCASTPKQNSSECFYGAQDRNDNEIRNNLSGWNANQKTVSDEKCRKSCLVLNLHNENVKKVKKRVTWEDGKNTIREYQIEEKNVLLKKCVKDAPMMSAQSKNENKLDEYLTRIFDWNPRWLEEQKKIAHEPPVYNRDKLHQMKNRYKSYNDYCDTLRPLLLLEIWNALTKESKSEENSYKYRKMHCIVKVDSVREIKTSSGFEPHSSFILETVISREDLRREQYPGIGHLIILRQTSSSVRKHIENNSEKKPLIPDLFAYVIQRSHTFINEKTHYNKNLVKYTESPEILLNLTVITKRIKFPSDMICVINGVMYLKSNIRELSALQYLPSSPLKSLILTPTVDDYKLPEVHLTGNDCLVTQDILNQKQTEAVLKISKAALCIQPKISLIHGPPGTGKSKVIVNIVVQILMKNDKARILVCAPSNAAVDELVLRLLHIRSSLNLKQQIKMVRVGRPESMNPKVKNVSLSELGKKQVERSIKVSIENEKKKDELELRRLEMQIKSLMQEIDETKNKEAKELVELYKQLLDYQRKKECLIVKMKDKDSYNNFANLEQLYRSNEKLMLEKATVIACTLSSCYSGMMERVFGGERSNHKIQICIVDEATQCCETENIIPILLGVQKMILVGDTNQLPATVLSKKAKAMKLDQSLFARIEKIFGEHPENPIIMLDTQYRMDYPILSWPNSYFYQGKLKNAAVVSSIPFNSYRVLNINSDQDQMKFSNTKEADFVSRIIYIMITTVDPNVLETPLQIGVITPYQNQRNVILFKIRKRLESVSSEKKDKVSIEVNTVDSFQGQERDVIVMSCVRSNGIGFMSDKQRLCVALTRAKSSLLLCGNFKTFEKDEMWYELLKNAKERSIYIDLSVDACLEEIQRHILK